MEATKIQWADSTLNLQMGCEGCELIKGVNVKAPTCYAKILTDRYAGRNGWPIAFNQPKIFPQRIKEITKWKDLTGLKRADKSWLDYYPRIIFLNDMGDTFSNGMPQDWFAEYLPMLAATKHIYMLLTKWPQRLAKFSQKYPLPNNIWVGTSVTSAKTAFRAKIINDEVQGGGIRWLSVEPMWSHINWKDGEVNKIELMIFGGHSGNGAKKCDIAWLSYQIEYCREHNICCFIKQLGAKVEYCNQPRLYIDHHGGDWNEWPSWLRVRQFPNPSFNQCNLFS